MRNLSFQFAGTALLSAALLASLTPAARPQQSAPDPAVDPALLAPRSDQIPQNSSLASPPTAPKQKKKPAHKDRELLLAAFTIPVAPLGFAPPAVHYLTHHVTQMSLDFFDEDHILFTFRVPGLIPRPIVGGQRPEYQRHIRAVVVQLSTGQTQAEDIWTLHDYERYLWMLNDGRFLLRDRNLLLVGDASLRLKPFLRFPGQIDTIELDPLDQFLVADTEESPSTPVNTTPVKRPTLLAHNGPDSDREDDPPPLQYLVRILSMQTRRVVLFSHTNGVVHLPIGSDGYYQVERADGLNWVVSHDDLQGNATPYWKIGSVCVPPLDTMAPGFLLASPCADDGSRSLVMLSLPQKRILWHTSIPATSVWPVLARAANGRRFARATLELNQPIGTSNPLDPDDIRTQKLELFDVADGNMTFVVDADPPLDAGGNFALSPSGQRFAVLRQGAIQVFQLPAPPPLPGVNPSPASPSSLR